MRRSMISASVFLCLEKQSGRLMGKANGGIKIPLRGPYSFEASSEIFPNDSQIGFRDITISLTVPKPKTQIWTNSNSDLEYQDSTSSNDHRVLSLSGFGFGRVLSPLAVLPAVAHSWQGPDCEYRAIIVVGKKPTAIRIQPDPSSRHSGRVFTRIQTASISALTVGFGEESWRALAWDKSLVLESEFDASSSQLSWIAANVPIIGSCRLELVRYEKH